MTEEKAQSGTPRTLLSLMPIKGSPSVNGQYLVHIENWNPISGNVVLNRVLDWDGKAWSDHLGTWNHGIQWFAGPLPTK